MRLPVEIRNKLNLDTGKSFLMVESWDSIPSKRYDRLLYYFKENDNEGNVLSQLITLCDDEALALVCNIPEVNKRLSNGHEKYNRDIVAETLAKREIDKFWFFETKNDNLFDLLVEV